MRPLVAVWLVGVSACVSAWGLHRLLGRRRGATPTLARRVLVFGHVRAIYGAAIAERCRGTEWEVALASDDPAEQLEQLKGTAVLVGGMGPANDVLRRAAECGAPLRLLQVPFTGCDWLDPSALPPGVTVCNVHNQSEGIAEYVLCAMLQWHCRLPEADAAFRAACAAAAAEGADAGFTAPWAQAAPPASRPELAGRTVGIVGYGPSGARWPRAPPRSACASWPPSAGRRPRPPRPRRTGSGAARRCPGCSRSRTSWSSRAL